MKRGVFVTFDVECSMGGAWQNPQASPVPPERAVMGRYGDDEYGLPLITDILNRNDIEATFFVDAFMTEQGHDGAEKAVCEYLLDRGQDVQLHIHPNHKSFGLKAQGRPHIRTDDMDALPPDEQLAILEEGRDRLAACTGCAPVAFRAGNMAASEEVLKQLAAARITIDSSYTFCFTEGQCHFAPEAPYNGSRWYGDVLEVALSGFTVPRFPGLHPAKPFDLMGISFEECRDAVRKTCDADADAVMILHSFSLFKVRNVQYDDGRLDRIVTRRFRRFCEWLAANREAYPAYTFSQLSQAVVEGRYVANAVPPCRLGLSRAIVRKAVQAVNRAYWI